MNPLTLPKWQLDAAREIGELISETRRMNAYRESGVGGGGYASYPTNLYPRDFARIIASHDPATKQAMADHEAADTMRPSQLPEPCWTA